MAKQAQIMPNFYTNFLSALQIQIPVVMMMVSASYSDYSLTVLLAM